MDLDHGMVFGERLKSLRERKNLTQTQLAELVGYKNYTTITKWESGSSLPRGKELKLLSNLFNVSADYLLGLDMTDNENINTIYSQLEPPRQKYVYDVAEQQLEEQNNVIEFPDRAKELIRGRRMAGGSALHVDDTDARKEVVSSALIPKGADELVEVVGKSMEPLIKDREEVYIRYQPTVENGEIAVVRIENEGVTCKRVYVEENSIRLKAENPDYEDMYYDAGQVTVLGKVLL